MVRVHSCDLGEPTQKLPRCQAQLDTNTVLSILMWVLFSDLFLILNYVYLCVGMCICVQVSKEARRGCRSPYSWTYRQ